MTVSYRNNTSIRQVRYDQYGIPHMAEPGETITYETDPGGGAPRGYTGATYQYPRLAASSFALITASIMQNAVHEGNAFMVSQRTALDEFDMDAPLTFYIIVPDTLKWAHLSIFCDANTPAYWELFEDGGDPSKFDVSGGVAVVPVNRNRNLSSGESGLTITKGATVDKADAACCIATEVAAKAADESQRVGVVLKQNTKYLVRAMSYADNNEGSLRLKWKEMTDME